jgi:hypothetical protein
MSIFRNIRARDGNVGLLTSYHDGSSSKEIDRYALAFEAIVHRLLFWMADMGMEEEHFMLNLTQNFNADILRVRDRWRAEFDERLKDLTSRNPSHTPEMLRRIALSMWTRGTPE